MCLKCGESLENVVVVGGRLGFEVDVGLGKAAVGSNALRSELVDELKLELEDLGLWLRGCRCRRDARR